MFFSYKQEVGVRLKEVRESMDMTQKQFCLFFGPTVKNVSNLSRYESGDVTPPLQLFLLLARNKINLNWLFTGEGKMYDATEAVSYAPKEKEYAEKLIEILRRKDDGTISAITQNIDTFLKVPDKAGVDKPEKKRKAVNGD